MERVVQCERSSCHDVVVHMNQLVFRVNQLCFEGCDVVCCVPKKILGAVGGIKKREMSTFEERRNNKHPLLDHSSTLSLLEQRPHRNSNHRIIISFDNAYS